MEKSIFYRVAEFTDGVDRENSVVKINFCWGLAKCLAHLVKFLFYCVVVCAIAAIAGMAICIFITFASILLSLFNWLFLNSALFIFQGFEGQAGIIYVIDAGMGILGHGSVDLSKVHVAWLNIPLAIAECFLIYFFGYFVCKIFSFERKMSEAEVVALSKIEETENAKKKNDINLRRSGARLPPLKEEGEVYGIFNLGTGSFFALDGELLSWDEPLDAVKYLDKNIVTKRHFEIRAIK